jgi:NCAIR mutase (PurE)-related protein
MSLEDDLGFARLDLERTARTGLPEAIYCAGKTPAQVAAIAARLAAHGDSPVIGTRCDAPAWEAVAAALPQAVYHEAARLFLIPPRPAVQAELAAAAARRGLIAVLAAGTSDLPVAEEAALTAEALGNRVTRIQDVGVAGLHRLLGRLPALREASVVIAVAGMEGALPSVVAGLISAPLVAVPTSVGYGANLGGLTALLAMLNGCAPGVAVVNIDNGFGAGCLAAKINRLSDVAHGE